MSPATLALRYAGFAAVATIANLGAQRIVLAWGDGAALFALAVATGTGVRAHSTKFALYTAMGLVTTAIFWARKPPSD